MTTTTFQQGVGGYTGTVDTFLRQSRPNNSYRTATNIDVDGADKANGEIQGLLYFSDVFGSGQGQIALGATITSATLTFSVSNGTRDSVSLYRMAQDWASLSSPTWNSLGNGVQTNGIEALSTPDITVASVSKGTSTIDVTSSLQAWSDGEDVYGWLLKMAGGDGFRFAASEGGNAPILSVTYDTPSNPVAGISVIESNGSTVVTEGGSGDTLAIALTKAPTSNVVITVSTSGSSDINFAPTSLTFSPDNWQTQQVVSINAINDNLVEGTETFNVTLSASSSDSAYNGKSYSVSVAVIDDDVEVRPLSPAVVAVHDTTLYSAGDPSGYGSGDPSGLAYVPGFDLLFIADSEHNESPYFSTVNLFATRLDGTFVTSYSMLAFTDEPTGLAYNPFNGLLYITDDDARMIFMVNPTDPTTKVGQIDVGQYGIGDAEDPVIDPVTGHIYLLNGNQRQLVELSETGNFIKSTVLPNAITDAEALAFDPANDVFYIASGSTRGTIFQTDRDGNILDSFDLLNSYRNPVTGIKPKLKGLELAPSSDPNDGDKMNLYVADYGADQQADGRVFEIDLYHDWFVA